MKELGAVVSTKSNEEKLNARFETHGVNAPLAATSRAVIHMYRRQEIKKKALHQNPRNMLAFKPKPYMVARTHQRDSAVEDM